jgi:diamine N-acetyltransferase
MSAISLKPITRENWRECVRLTVADDQRDFVAPNVYSLLQYLCQDPTDTFVPLGIYDGETMVGVAMYGMGEFGGLTGWEIWRLMIDKNHQHKGCGRQALHLLIDLLREKFNPDAIYIMFEPDNHVAQRFYQSFGFHDTGMIDDGECVYRLDLKDH